MQIDLNANIGESFGRWSHGDDEAFWPVISTANIACGFHAGDPASMRRACQRAVEAGVRIAGLVGYRDLFGFGERFVDADPGDLAAELAYQLGALDGVALSVGGNMTAMRLAGALGVAVSQHRAHAHAVVEAIQAYDPRLEILVPAGSPFADLAQQAGLEIRPEAPAADDPQHLLSGLRDGSLATVHVTEPAAAKQLLEGGVSLKRHR